VVDNIRSRRLSKERKQKSVAVYTIHIINRRDYTVLTVDITTMASELQLLQKAASLEGELDDKKKDDMIQLVVDKVESRQSHKVYYYAADLRRKQSEEYDDMRRRQSNEFDHMKDYMKKMFEDQQTYMGRLLQSHQAHMDAFMILIKSMVARLDGSSQVHSTSIRSTSGGRSSERPTGGRLTTARADGGNHRQGSSHFSPSRPWPRAGARPECRMHSGMASTPAETAQQGASEVMGSRECVLDEGQTVSSARPVKVDGSIMSVTTDRGDCDDEEHSYSESESRSSESRSSDSSREENSYSESESRSSESRSSESIREEDSGDYSD
jgi:hypothetical protein